MQKQLVRKTQFVQEDYEEIEEIGRGCFGTVHKIRRKSDGRVFVWKKICYENMSQQEKIQIVNEVNVLRKLNHRNIIKYIDRIIDKQNQQIYIVMEYCDEGDLGNILKKKKLGISIEEEDAISIFIQLLDALNYCHTRNNRVLHRDIKPQNIFMITPSSSELMNKIHEGSRINRDLDQLDKKATIVKLGDFGLARYLSGKNQLATTHVGTPYYMSPEVMGKGEYDEKSDIWSLGCCIYEILAGRPPFYARSYDELRNYVKDGIVPDLPKRYSNEFNSVLKLMFERDPHKRPSAEEIFNLDFIKFKTSMLSTKLDLYFLVHEYKKIICYNQFLESLLKNDLASRKKTSEESILDTSLDSSASTGIACSNNENLSHNSSHTASQEYKRYSSQVPASQKIECDRSSMISGNEKLFYITPKRKNILNNTGLKDNVPESVDVYYKSNSKIFMYSPVTAPTRLSCHKDKSLLKKKQIPDPKDLSFQHTRRLSAICNENSEEGIMTPVYPGVSSNSSNSSKNCHVKSSTTFRKGDDIIFESEQRLSRWIQRFHSRNKSSI